MGSGPPLESEKSCIPWGQVGIPDVLSLFHNLSWGSLARKGESRDILQSDFVLWVARICIAAGRHARLCVDKSKCNY